MEYPFWTKLESDQRYARKGEAEGVLIIHNLKVTKNPANTDLGNIENKDYCEGWVSNDMFIKGTWVNATNANGTSVLDANNWSDYIEY